LVQGTKGRDKTPIIGFDKGSYTGKGDSNILNKTPVHISNKDLMVNSSLRKEEKSIRLDENNIM
jgi:hypothetical protein